MQSQQMADTIPPVTRERQPRQKKSSWSATIEEGRQFLYDLERVPEDNLARSNQYRTTWQPDSEMVGIQQIQVMQVGAATMP